MSRQVSLQFRISSEATERGSAFISPCIYLFSCIFSSFMAGITSLGLVLCFGSWRKAGILSHVAEKGK